MKFSKIAFYFLCGIFAILGATYLLWHEGAVFMQSELWNEVYRLSWLTVIVVIYTLTWFIGLPLCLFLRKRQIFSEIKSWQTYKKMWPYARPYWFRLAVAILVTIPIGAMDAVIAWSLKPFMDVVLIEKQAGWTKFIPLMIVVFSVLQALFTYAATYLNTWVGNKISLNLKRDLFNKLLHKDAAFFDKKESGFVLMRFNNDAESACGGLLTSLRMFSTRFFSSISLLFVLFYNSWQLAVVALIVLFGALLPLTRMRKRLKSAISKNVSVMTKMLKDYNEVFSGNRIIAAYNLFSHCQKNFAGTLNDIFNLSLKIARKTGIISPIMHTMSAVGIAFVIWYGSYLIVSQQITVGNFASFITSLVMLYNPLKSIGNNANAIIMSLMAAERVLQNLESKNRIISKPKA